MDLSQLQRGERAKVVGVACAGAERRRLTELGLRAGALRPHNAAHVVVEPETPDA